MKSAIVRIDEDGEVQTQERLERGRDYLRMIRRTLLRIDRLSSGLIEPHGLTNQQFLALLLIRDNEGLTQVELTKELDSDQNTVSAMLRRLAARALVKREPHLTDRRAIRLVVTPEGAALIDETQPDIDQLSLTLEAMMPIKHEAVIVAWLQSVTGIKNVK